MVAGADNFESGTGSDPERDLPKSIASIVGDYRSAVYSEMFHLRDNGGRRYKVTNGRYIGRSDESYAYSFELGSELFISDDAPITFTSGSESAKGNVFACEDFQILVTLEKSVGDKIASGYISVEPWKLLEALGGKLAQLSSSDEIALTLLEGANLRTSEPIERVDTGQEKAMEHALRDPVTVIWGPPGTGKTHTMAEIAIRFMGMGKSVLVVSHSNISVDGVAAKIAELMRMRDLGGLLREGKVLRFGYVRDRVLAVDSEVSSYGFAMSKNPALRCRMDALEAELDKLKVSDRAHSDRRLKVEKEIKRIRKSIVEAERDSVCAAQVVATTVSKLYSNKIFDGRLFDVVMFDEVSMAYVPQVLCAAMHAKERMVCVGDFRQLAPIAQGPPKTRRVLSSDIFWYLGICDRLQNAYYHPWLVMLDEQRRMHPAISAFPSKAYYRGMLKDHASVFESRKSVAELEPFAGDAMTLLDLSGTFCVTGRNSDNSRFSILSAAVSFALALEAERTGGGTVGVIAPYAAQVRLVRAMLQDYRARKRRTEVACATVHQFQGSERDVIVIDTVEAPPSKQPGKLTSNNEGGSVDRLVNVAVTRARGKLVTVAHRSFWDAQRGKGSSSFCALLEHHERCDNVVSVREGGLAEFLAKLDFGPNIKAYTDVDDALPAFERDIERAASKISVAMPDGGVLEEHADGALELLLSAKARGVEVTIKCREWTRLPEGWKPLAWQSDDAYVPVVVIDGSVVWYGLPAVRGTFSLSEGRGCRTVLQTPMRIKGDKTIEMIQSLTDIDFRVVEGQRKPIKPRSSTADDDGRGGGQDGLALYVSQKEKCPKCKSPMRLAKGRSSGKFFMACTSCKETGLLSKEFVNRYICAKQTRCPKCKSRLTARVSKYGIYIKCDRDHTVKPDEI